MSEIFRAIVEPSVERVAIVEVQHKERHDGRDFVISHTVRRNIFTEFDRKLSRHLAAVRNKPFPAVSVTARVREAGDPSGWQKVAGADYPSIPQALLSIAGRAVEQNGVGELSLRYHGLSDPTATGTVERVIEQEDVSILEAGLELCQRVGEFAFLDISGDFDLIIVTPPEPDLKPMLMDLFNRRLTLPPVPGLTAEYTSIALFDFEKALAEDVLARTYLAALRTMLTAQKERAVLEFRRAAEQRILDFELARRGRPLVGFRLDAVTGLVRRLRAGLGDSLSGLSEDAQITAFDWAEAVAAGGEPPDGADGNGARAEREPLPWPHNRHEQGSAAGAI